MFVAVIVWATYSIYVKQHSSKLPFYGGLFVIVIVGMVCLFPFTLLEWREWLTIRWSLMSVLGLLFLGLCPSVLAFIAWNKAVVDIGPSRASIFFNLIPVFTTLFAMLLLGEKVSWVQVLGGIMVLGGVYLSTRVHTKHVAHQSEIKHIHRN